MVVHMMLSGMLVTMLTFNLCIEVNATDLGTIINECLFAIWMVHVAIEFVSSSKALIVLLLHLLLVSNSCLSILFLLNLCLLSFESCLSLGFFLFLCQWFFVGHILVSEMSHTTASVSMMLMASVLSECFRRVESALRELFRGELAL